MKFISIHNYFFTIHFVHVFSIRSRFLRELSSFQHLPSINVTLGEVKRIREAINQLWQTISWKIFAFYFLSLKSNQLELPKTPHPTPITKKNTSHTHSFSLNPLLNYIPNPSPVHSILKPFSSIPILSLTEHKCDLERGQTDLRGDLWQRWLDPVVWENRHRCQILQSTHSPIIFSLSKSWANNSKTPISISYTSPFPNFRLPLNHSFQPCHPLKNSLLNTNHYLPSIKVTLGEVSRICEATCDSEGSTSSSERMGTGVTGDSAGNTSSWPLTEPLQQLRMRKKSNTMYSFGTLWTWGQLELFVQPFYNEQCPRTWLALLFWETTHIRPRVQSASKIWGVKSTCVYFLSGLVIHFANIWDIFYLRCICILYFVNTVYLKSECFFH